MGVLAVSALLAASCSGGGSSAGPTTAPAPAASSAPAATSTGGSGAEVPTTAPDTTGSSGAGGSPAPSAPLTAPEGDAFYTPPEPLPGDGPGDLIWARPLANPPAQATGWQVLYRSESVGGDPIAVSGIVVAPQAAPASGSAAVLAWAHGTTGLGDDCAPSRTLGQGFSPETILAGTAVGRGWTFVATDYEGLGTPGVHPYLVGPSEGRSVLDVIRAASQLPGSGVDAGSPVAIFGHSQGGHAALMAAEIASTYAPELDLVGTVAGAPPGDLARIASATAGLDGVAGPSGFGLMMRAGFLAAYPELDPAAVIAEDDRALLDEVGDTCTQDAFELARDLEREQPDPAADPAWKQVLDASSPGAVVPEGPVLIIHGDADRTVPPELSRSIRERYCALGVSVQRTVYPGQDHGGVVIAAIVEILSWIQARVSGLPATSNCAVDQPV